MRFMGLMILLIVAASGLSQTVFVPSDQASSRGFYQVNAGIAATKPSGIAATKCPS
jgi:hypothetical protein